MKTLSEIINILTDFDKRNKIGWTIGELHSAARHLQKQQGEETNWSDDEVIKELLFS